jgi:hypothetical protein
MLESIHLKNVGPAPEMKMDLAPRLNLITGDNGLGKSFLLDVAWWVLTRTWAREMVIPKPGAKAAICRRWFLPDARVGDRQRACGAAECQRARHREADRAWHARHPDYDRGRRWQKAVEAAKAGAPPRPPDRPAPLSGVPWDIAQDAMTHPKLL